MRKMQERVKPSPIRYTTEEAKERLRELILYIAARCEDDPTFGAVKLNKILFFADYLSYLGHGEPITGAQYQKLPQGPCPVHLVPIREELKAAGDIVIRKQAIFFKTQHRIIPLREPNLDLFKARDIALVEEVIDDLRGRNATEVSDMAHGLAWQVAKEGEIIPYETVLLWNFGTDEEDVEEAKQLIEEHGWQGA